MRKWLLAVVTVLFMAVLTVVTGITEASAATKTGTTSDGFSYKILSDGTVEITHYDGRKKRLVFPDKIKGKKVTKIGADVLCDADWDNTIVISVEIPDSVTTVESNAFDYSPALTTIKFGKNVEHIGKNIEDARLMKPGGSFRTFEVSPENKVYYAVDGVLFGKDGNGEQILLNYPIAKRERAYDIPEGTTKVDLMAFDYAQKLSVVTFPATVHEIPELLMYNAYSSNLSEIKVDEANQRYYAKDGVLFEKENEKMKYYNEWGGDRLLFYPRKKKESFFQVPEGVKTIGESACYAQPYLEIIEMPDTVSYIGDYAFNNCEKLKKAVISGTIGKYAFDNCLELSEAELKNTVGIDENAFESCGLKNIIIPESTQWIGFGAFFPCYHLEWIEFRNKDCDIRVKKKGNHCIGYANRTVIYGYPDSTAEKFAKRAGQEFKIIGESRPDENRQGTITEDTVKLSQTSYTYDGKAKKPKVVVKDKFGNKIVDCYSVTYKNNKNVGEATVEIRLDGISYTGIIQKTFVINPPKSKIIKTVSGKNNAILHWKGVKASQISGYEIQYSTNEKFKKENTKQIRLNQRNAKSKKIKNLKSGKTYYVRIRSFKAVKIDGKTKRLYSQWSNRKKIKVQ